MPGQGHADVVELLLAAALKNGGAAAVAAAVNATDAMGVRPLDDVLRGPRTRVPVATALRRAGAALGDGEGAAALRASQACAAAAHGDVATLRWFYHVGGAATLTCVGCPE